MDYFKDCQTFDEAKTAFRMHAHKTHPDRGGDSADFIDLKNQFENFDPVTLKYRTERENWKPTEFMGIIERLLHLENVRIQILGAWIWIDGDTRPVSDQIKDAIKDAPSYVCNWNRKRVAWQIHQKGYRRRHREDLTREEIEANYGVENVKMKYRQKVA